MIEPIAGGVVSRTVTVSDPDPTLPCVSVDWQFTVVVPSAKIVPDAGVQVTSRPPSTASTAVAENVTTAPAGLVASATTLPAVVTCGPVVSCTVTVKERVAVLPCVSDAEHVTSVGPNG